MRQELKSEDRKKIVQAISAGDRIEATNIYITITGRGLTEAQTFIKTLTAEVKSTEQEKQTAKQLGKRNLWDRLKSPLKKGNLGNK